MDDDTLAAASRRLRSRADAILAAVWFMPEAAGGWPELGLPPLGLASRAACMGRVQGTVAAAAFAPMNPARVASAIDTAWTVTDPDTLVAARLDAATRFLASRLGGDQPPGVERAVALLVPAARAAPPGGHPVYAGLLAQPAPDTSIGSLWRACDLVREHRGDSHVAAWQAADVDGVEINLLSEAWRGLPAGSVAAGQMGWSPDDVTAATHRLAARGLLVDGALTADGRALREEIETATDRQERPIVAALGDALDEVLDLLTPWARAVMAAGASPAKLARGDVRSAGGPSVPRTATGPGR
jgi:hypothetical protein